MIYITGDNYRVELAKGLPEENGIQTVILNRKDSSYNVFGDVEMYVNIANKAKSIGILKTLKSGDS